MGKNIKKKNIKVQRRPRRVQKKTIYYTPKSPKYNHNDNECNYGYGCGESYRVDYDSSCPCCVYPPTLCGPCGPCTTFPGPCGAFPGPCGPYFNPYVPYMPPCGPFLPGPACSSYLVGPQPIFQPFGI
jgi:hypothetical protein